MKEYISEGRAMYEDENHGLFSKKLAEWAIGKMEYKDPTTKEFKKIKARTLEDVQMLMKENNIEMPEEFIYTAWYLFNMTIADYPKTLTNDKQRIMFVEETICDPDGMPENVLSCFEAKMCNAEIPIHWERML